MLNSSQTQAVAWISDHMKDDASITIENVLTKRFRSVMNGSRSLPFEEEEDDRFHRELYLHIARKGEYSEVCVSYPLTALSEMREKSGWEWMVRVFRKELGQAGILREESEDESDMVWKDEPDPDWNMPFHTEWDADPEKRISFPGSPLEQEIPQKASKNGGRKSPSAQELMESMDEEDRALFEQLRTLRKEMALSKSVAPYVIFSNRTLAAMCEKLPVTLEELRELPGVGKRNSVQYGEPFLEAIRNSACAAETAP